MLEELREQMLAEQAEQIARLQLRNEIRTAGLIIWGVLLLGWVIFCFVKLMKDLHNSASIKSGEIAFTCETCGASFQVSADSLARHPFTPVKTVRTGRTVRQSRRLSCPYCRKKTWCRQDMAQSYQIGMGSLGEAAGKNLFRFLIGALVLSAAGGFFFLALNIIF